MTNLLGLRSVLSLSESVDSGECVVVRLATVSAAATTAITCLLQVALLAWQSAVLSSQPRYQPHRVGRTGLLQHLPVKAFTR